MRAFGIALVLASVLLGSGGVVYRRTAHAETAAPVAADPDADQTCRAEPTPNSVEPQLRHTRLAEPSGDSQVIVLGGTGFNYSRPGDPVPTRVKVAEPEPAPASAAD